MNSDHKPKKVSLKLFTAFEGYVPSADSHCPWADCFISSARVVNPNKKNYSQVTSLREWQSVAGCDDEQLVVAGEFEELFAALPLKYRRESI